MKTRLLSYVWPRTAAVFTTLLMLYAGTCQQATRLQVRSADEADSKEEKGAVAVVVPSHGTPQDGDNKYGEAMAKTIRKHMTEWKRITRSLEGSADILSNLVIDPLEEERFGELQAKLTRATDDAARIVVFTQLFELAQNSTKKISEKICEILRSKIQDAALSNGSRICALNILANLKPETSLKLVKNFRNPDLKFQGLMALMDHEKISDHDRGNFFGEAMELIDSSSSRRAFQLQGLMALIAHEKVSCTDKRKAIEKFTKLFSESRSANVVRENPQIGQELIRLCQDKDLAYNLRSSLFENNFKKLILHHEQFVSHGNYENEFAERKDVYLAFIDGIVNLADKEFRSMMYTFKRLYCNRGNYQALFDFIRAKCSVVDEDHIRDYERASRNAVDEILDLLKDNAPLTSRYGRRYEDCNDIQKKTIQNLKQYCTQLFQLLCDDNLTFHQHRLAVYALWRIEVQTAYYNEDYFHNEAATDKNFKALIQLLNKELELDKRDGYRIYKACAMLRILSKGVNYTSELEDQVYPLAKSVAEDESLSLHDRRYALSLCGKFFNHKKKDHFPVKKLLSVFDRAIDEAAKEDCRLEPGVFQHPKNWIKQELKSCYESLATEFREADTDKAKINALSKMVALAKDAPWIAYEVYLFVLEQSKTPELANAADKPLFELAEAVWTKERQQDMIFNDFCIERNERKALKKIEDIRPKDIFVFLDALERRLKDDSKLADRNAFEALLHFASEARLKLGLGVMNVEKPTYEKIQNAADRVLEKVLRRNPSGFNNESACKMLVNLCKQEIERYTKNLQAEKRPETRIAPQELNARKHRHRKKRGSATYNKLSEEAEEYDKLGQQPEKFKKHLIRLKRYKKTFFPELRVYISALGTLLKAQPALADDESVYGVLRGAQSHCDSFVKHKASQAFKKLGKIERKMEEKQ